VNRDITDRPIAPQLGPVHKKDELPAGIAVFYGMFPAKLRLACM
jgi:hypothetical protein